MSIKDTLIRLNRYITEKGVEGEIVFQSETSHLVRAANNQISLNTSEKASAFHIELQKGKKQSCISVVADINDIQNIQDKIDIAYHNLSAVKPIPFLTPMQPIAQLQSSLCFDASMEALSSKRLQPIFQMAVEQFSERNTLVSGAFSAGIYEYGIINTLATKPLYFKGSDYNIELVLQLIDGKRELRVSRVGESIAQFDETSLCQEMAQLLHLKETTPRIDLKPDRYDVIFGPDAMAELILFLEYLACSGETYEYETGMLQKNIHHIGDKLLGENFSLTDDPTDTDVLFRRPFGINGIKRQPFPLFKNGVLKDLIYSDKLDCDRFKQKRNNDSATLNLKMQPGQGPSEFSDMVNTCQPPTIYIPYLHYLNYPNPAKGEVTGTSRFGTFLINQGEITHHLYNLRINETLFHVFNHIDWMSDTLWHSNISDTYDARMAQAICLPRYTKVERVNITGT